jgi:hypothetical protein
MTTKIFDRIYALMIFITTYESNKTIYTNKHRCAQIHMHTFYNLQNHENLVDVELSLQHTV